MTKDEIKKALECCDSYVQNACAECPYCYVGKCRDKLQHDALDLITEQEKENEKLEQLNAIQCDAWQKVSDENESLATENSSYFQYNSVLRKENKKLKEEIKQAKTDVLNELKKRSYCDNTFTDGKWHRYILIDDIDKLIEEIE